MSFSAFYRETQAQSGVPRHFPIGAFSFILDNSREKADRPGKE